MSSRPEASSHRHHGRPLSCKSDAPTRSKEHNRTGAAAVTHTKESANWSRSARPLTPIMPPVGHWQNNNCVRQCSSLRSLLSHCWWLCRTINQPSDRSLWDVMPDVADLPEDGTSLSLGFTKRTHLPFSSAAFTWKASLLCHSLAFKQRRIVVARFPKGNKIGQDQQGERALASSSSSSSSSWSCGGHVVMVMVVMVMIIVIW